MKKIDDAMAAALTVENLRAMDSDTRVRFMYEFTKDAAVDLHFKRVPPPEYDPEDTARRVELWNVLTSEEMERYYTLTNAYMEAHGCFPKYVDHRGDFR